MSQSPATGALSALALVVLAAPPGVAADVSAKTVLTGLSEPRDVAIRPGGTPESYEIFVADMGARRVIKMASDKPNESTEVITGFPEVASDSDEARTGNPLCLLFLDSGHLVAGLAGSPPEVRLYQLADADAPISADEAKQRVTAELREDAPHFPPDRCHALIRTRPNDVVSDALLVTVASLDEPLSKIPIRAGMLGTMTQFETKSGSGPTVSRPAALAVSDQGYVVVAEGGFRQKEMQLMFLNPTNGQVVMRVPTGLSELVGLAYSPKTGNLYAAAKADGTPNEVGVFRIDEASGKSFLVDVRAATAVKVADVARPTQMAFGPDGALYVTALGEPGDDESPRGVLLKLTGEL